MCETGCLDCQPLVDTAPEIDGFKIELVSCNLLTPTTRKFIYEITPVGSPPRDISNILVCLCPDAYVENSCELTVTDSAQPTCEFETNPNAEGNPVKCQGIKFEGLGDNKETGDMITISFLVDDQLVTVKPIEIGYKAATFDFIWEVCGPSCNIQPVKKRKRGIKF